jgi:uncharacterized membrane protein YqgA involved in biofilm formation
MSFPQAMGPARWGEKNVVLFGALMNGLEAFVGGVLGLLFKRHVSDELGDFLLKGQGLCVVLVAVQGMVAKGGSIAVVTMSVALGSLIGYAVNIDGWVKRLGDWAQERLNRLFSGSERMGSFSEGFVASTLFCCTGAMAILGSISAGIQLDPSTLIAKGVIDLVVCLPLAATLGIGVPFCGISLVVYEGVLSILASLVGPLLSSAAIVQMGVTGSVLLLAVGTNLMGLTNIKVANILPAAFLPIAFVPLASLVTSIL